MIEGGFDSPLKKALFAVCLLSLASIPSPGQTAEDFLNNGNAQFNQQRYAAAVAEYTRAIALNPNFFMAYYNRGTSYVKLENYTAAIVDLTRAVALDPSYVNAFYNRGFSYLKSNSPDRAVADYSQVILLDPNSPRPISSGATLITI
jgi:tetratricopeptide (TPR) repeat protein